MTTLTSTACQTFGTTGFFQNPPKFVEEGYIIRAATYTGLSLTASVTAVLQMVPIPKGVQLHDCMLQWKGLAGTSLTVSVGDNNNNARYIASASITAASGVARLGGFVAGVAGGATLNAGGFGYSYSADNTVNLYITANGSGSSVAAANFRLTIMYSADNNQKG
ncbi:hypothetical protein [Bradyrhizobium sp.]